MTTSLQDFIGNPDAFARQNDDGTYTPIRRTINPGELQQHARGEASYGTYVVWFDKAHFIVFDIDEHDLDLAKQLAAECDRRGLDAGIEFSGRKGFHVWMLSNAWHEASDLQRLGRDIAATVGFNGEVFPKQGVARDLGSLVKLPLGVHAVTKNRSAFIREPMLNVPERVDAAIAKLPPDTHGHAPTGQSGLPCMDSIQNDPPKPGTRNNLYFHMACQMRRGGLHAEAIQAVLEELFKNPDPGEIEAIVANSEFSGPICSQLPPERHCGEACILARSKGLSVRPGQVKQAIEGELVVVKVAKHKANMVEFEHPDAEQAKAVLRKEA